MNIAVIGLGLMGGSFALDIKSVYANSKIFGIDNSDSNLKEALALDLIDQIITYDDLIKMDIVLVSIPVNYSLIVIPKVLEKINENCVKLGYIKT